MTIKVGDKIPSVQLQQMTNGSPESISSDSLFKGKRVALFAVPGAFTPTCSAKHLPGFVSEAETLKAKGIDEIVCISVNDAFVMDAWGNSQNVDGKVKMVADGNGAFANALGLDLDASKFGMGQRSKRYSMVVDDGVVQVLNVEEPGAFSVSSVEHMLQQL